MARKLPSRIFAHPHASGRRRGRPDDGLAVGRLAAFIAALVLAGWPVTGRAAHDVSILDVIELDTGYTTLTDQFYRRLTPQQLLDGARVGMLAYLYERGITDAALPLLRARSDGRGVVPAIEQQLGAVLVRYGTAVDARELVYAALRGELAAAHDPYSVFFTAAELRGFSAALDGRSFAGIGVVIAGDPAGGYVADTVFDDGPAAHAGLLAGDRIVAIDDVPVAAATPTQIASRLRGRIGAVVRLDVRRTGSAEPLRLSIARAAVTPPDVTARLLPGAVGYVALRTFGPAAGPHVHAALTRLRALGARATIFDLRGNGGGYESSAVAVASAFVPAGPIVVTQTKHGRRVVTLADGSAPLPLPLVVLVDGDSASGSELVTAAISDRGLGSVVGTRTFGKGLVQTMFPLPDGSAMKVTTARYVGPAGHDIDRVGITPDEIVSEPSDAQRGVPGHDAQLDAGLARLNAGR